MIRLGAVGDNCIDLIRPAHGGRGQRLVGGNAVNVAVQAARLGARSAYFGAVGHDANGDLVTRALAENGVRFEGLVRHDRPTSRTILLVGPDGDRRIAEEDFGACSGYEPDETAVGALMGMDHVHLGWLNDGGALRRRLAAAGRSVSQDISVNATPEDLGVEGLAIAFASLLGSHDAARDLAGQLRAQGARGVVVTRGAAGSSVFLGEEEFEHLAHEMEPLDTTGAGDSYIAAFLHAYLIGCSLREAAEAGTRLASQTCRHMGGFPQNSGLAP